MDKRSLLFKSEKTRIPGGLLVLVLVCLLSGVATAQLLCEPTFSIPYFTVDTTPATQVRGDSYNTIITVGETEGPLTSNDFGHYSVATGFWSHYLTEPMPPLVTSTDGDHIDRIEVSWEIVDDRTGPPVTDKNVILYRNGTVLTTMSLDQTQYLDFNVFPGEEYEYAVVPGNSLGKSHLDEDVGFLNPNGTIIGHVETPSGNPVPHVKVVLTPNLGRSAFFENDSYAYFPGMLTGLEQSYTIEGWFRSRESQAQTLFAAVDSATTRPFARLQLTATGALSWEHRGQTSTEGDVITTPVSYTEDAEWHHFAAVLADSNMSMTLYVDGRIVSTGTAADTIGTQKSQVVLGKLGPIQHAQYLQGRLDDWRIWNIPKSRPAIRRDMDRTLEGDEDGLVAYWKFDEVKGETIFDLTSNDQDGVLCRIERSEFQAPVFVSGVTDTLGNYAIRNIFYGQGTTFTVTPQKRTPIGRSLKFDGVDDYVAFPFDRLDLTGGYTLEGWFKHPGSNGVATLFAAVDPEDDSDQVRLVLLDDGRLQFTHLAGQITSTERYDVEFWYHFALTHDADTGGMALYVDGELIGTATGAALDALSAYVLARQAPEVDAQHYTGWLDEIRVWDRSRSLEQINAVKLQVLQGNETGMIAYWKLNEGDGFLLTDATGSDHTGEIVDPKQWTDDIPLDEDFVHTFEPESRQAILNPGNTTIDQVDFTDISQIAVSGFVKYASTACFIEGAEILVNGESRIPSIRTDANGKFVAEFEPGARGQQLSVRYKDHEVAPGFIELPRLVVPLTGLFFEDLVTREFSGTVAGGVCQLPITPTQGRIEVTLSSVDGCFETVVVPDEQTGQFVAQDLPPVIYQVTVAHPNPEIDDFFTGETLSLEEEDGQIDFIYRSAPQVAVTGFPQNSCGLRVMDMIMEYDLDISVFESYTSQGQTQTCATDTGSIVLIDNISERGQTELEFKDGQLQHALFAGNPNILGGGDHPYQKSVQVTATDTLGRNATVEEWTYVVGNRPRPAQNFATTAPEMPFMILRDPPGDESISYIEQGTSMSTSMGFNIDTGVTTTVFATAHMGFWNESGGSFGGGAAIVTDGTVDFTAEVSVGISQSSTSEQTWSFTANERIATEPDVAGDVYIGGALNIQYGITDVLEIDENSCGITVRPDLIMAPAGFATTFIYSESFITGNVIPELETLGDVASADRWRSFIARNNQLKDAASFVRNISFDANTEFESTETTEISESSFFEFQIEIGLGVGVEVGAKVAGVGVSGGVKVNTQMAFGNSRTSEQTKTTTVGYILSDDDPGDNFSVDVKQDPVYGTPVFELVSGVTKCPWEPGSVHVDNPSLTVSPTLAVDVPPDEPALFDLSIGNLSEAGEERFYDLRVVNESNPDGAYIELNSTSVEDGLTFTVPFGETVNALLSIFRGPEEYAYDDLQVQLVSPCEYDRYLMGEGHPPQGTSDTVSVAVRYTVPCSEAAIAFPEPNWLITAADQTDVLQITLNDYDRDDPNLEKLDLQYRPAAGGDWFTAFSIPAAELTEDFVLRSWDISPSVIADGAYELRAVAFCGIGLVPGTSPVVKGRIDRQPPALLGAPEPTDGILHPDDRIAVRFNEEINCGAISVGAGHVVLTNAVTGQDVDFTHTCGGNELVLDPNIQNVFLENLTLRGTVGPLEDLFGNGQTEPIQWEFFVNRNPIEWSGLDIRDIVFFEDQSYTTTRTLVNNGGSNRSYDITDVPSWLSVEPRSGTILPGDAQTVTFSVDGTSVGAGAFKKTVFASGTQGNEPRLVDLRVLCHPPDWGEVVPADFLHSMNITATLSTDGELSDDIYDRVGVFIDDKLHGTANVLFVEPLDGLADTHAYEVYLTVYGNDASVGKALEFRVWDASACSELGLVLENFDFGINATHGTPTNPATITATSQIIGTLPFPAGWTWFSLNLIADDMSTNVVLGTLAPESQDILRAQRSFSQYVPGAGWVGSLGQLANESMYLLNLSRPDTLQVIGYAVDVETTSIPVEQGWNWIGYLPQQSMAVNRALESLNAQTGDVVKSQFEFAQFVEGLGWMGSLRFMNPRMAYQLSAQEAGTLAYPFFAGDPATKTAEPTRMATPSGWAVDPRAYRYNMPLVVRIAGDGVTLDSESDVIAAFVGDEVRGVGQTVYVPSQDRYLSFLMVYGNTAEGEPVEFRFYDADQHRERFVATEAEFRADALRGGVHVPFVLETRERRLGDRGFVPDSFVLGQSYPNPFNPSTKIGYGLPQDGQIEIAVYNLLGQKIRTLVSGFEKAGYRHVTWDGRTNESQLVPSGMYFYVMESGNFRDVKKVMLLK